MKNELRDLGFGTRVRTGRGDRLIERDGSFTVKRTGMPLRSLLSLSHRLLVMRWDVFLLLLTLSYLGWNALFGCLFMMLGEGAIEGPGGGFGRAFFFSVQTASTIGYGHLIPATTAANVLATMESLGALIVFALVTGLTYARFARPLADIAYSDRALIAPYALAGTDPSESGRSLQFRVANRRKNQILSLRARVMLSRVVRTGDQVSRTFHELDLERHQVAFFPLSWTIVHPITPTSPLYQTTEAELLASDAEVLVMLTGIDETFSHTVHSRCSYKADEIVWDARFTNIFEHAESGIPTSMDIARIDEHEPTSA